MFLFYFRTGGSKYTHFENFEQDNEFINGLKEYFVEIRQHIDVKDSRIFDKADSGSPNIIQLNFKDFKPGSIVAIKVSQPSNVRTAIQKLRELMKSFSQTQQTDLKNIINELKLEDLNRALYRCDQEERDDGKGFDVYNIPNFGSLVYAGLQGTIFEVE